MPLLPFLWYYKYISRKQYPSAREHMHINVLPFNAGIVRTYAIATFSVGYQEPDTFLTSFQDTERAAWRELAQLVYNDKANVG